MAEAIDRNNPESALMAAEEPVELAPRRKQRSRAGLLRRAVEELPQPDRDIMRLRLMGKSESQVGEVLSMPRITVHFGIERAKRRLQWLTRFGLLFTTEELQEALASRNISEKRAEALVGMWRTTSAAALARELGIGTHAVEVRFAHGLVKVEQWARKEEPMRRFAEGLRTLATRGPGRGMRYYQPHPEHTAARLERERVKREAEEARMAELRAKGWETWEELRARVNAGG